MGEIADMMIYGAMCPCGVFVGDALEVGYQRFCSLQCAEDYSGDYHPEQIVGCHEIEDAHYLSNFRYRLFCLAKTNLKIRIFHPGLRSRWIEIAKW